MYKEHFGLKELPFSISPDPRYLFLSKRHRDALAHLFYGIQSQGGFILLTGEVGTGKTTLCRCLLEQIPEDVETAFVLNPKLTAVELLATICDEYGIEYPEGAGVKLLVDRLNDHLLQSHSSGKRCVLIIDEAQNLAMDVLEQIRLLTNLETNQHKLLQIILLGQPELLDMLDKREMRQLNQRITARYHLEALNLDETREYVRHRLTVAGGGASPFQAGALRRIYRLSKGVPRVINLICDRALLGTYSKGRHNVSAAIVGRAAREALRSRVQYRYRTAYAAAGVAIMLAALFAALQFTDLGSMLQPEPEVTQVAPAPAFVSPFELSGHPSIDVAYHDLFALWGLAFEDRTSAPCKLAASMALSCKQQSGTLVDLETLNRPVVLKVGRNWLTLSSLGETSATLIAGQAQYELTREDLAAHWDGTAYYLTSAEVENPPLLTSFAPRG